MSPEREFARTVLHQFGLSPPVDLRRIVDGCAEIAFCSLPGTADGVVVRRSGRKSLILVSKNLKLRRRRFTIAHELGHVLLPWQLGMAACHADATYVASRHAHMQMEAEANRFASELLVPSAWLREQMTGAENELPGLLFAASDRCQVSSIVIVLAMAKASPFPAAACLIDTREGRQYEQRTKGFPLGKTSAWWEKPDLIERAEGILRSETCGSYLLHTLTFALPKQSRVRRPHLSSGELLKKILRGTSDAQRVESLVNGVIGAKNPRIQDLSLPERQQALRRALLAKEQCAVLTTHKLFDEFLAARVHELNRRP